MELYGTEESDISDLNKQTILVRRIMFTLGVGVFMAFVDNNKNIKYPQTLIYNL